jgi:glucan phosphoethanolaminetransferase (alkaline phosphatase superfamily)
MKNYVNILFSTPILAVLDQAIFSGTNFLLTLFLAQKLEISGFGVLSSVTVLTFLFLSISNALIIQPFQVSIVTINQKKQYIVFLYFFQLLLLVLIVLIMLILNVIIDDNEINKASIDSIIVFVLGYLFQDFFRKLFLGTDEIKKVLNDYSSKIK